MTPSQVLIGMSIYFSWCWSMELLRRRSDGLNTALMHALGSMAHPHERHQINSATWFASSFMLLVKYS